MARVAAMKFPSGGSMKSMRVIAGQYRSRSLTAPAGQSTRPTSDRLRETLFNVLAPRIEGAVFLDLYAGSGAVGIEALSRGAQQAIFVDQAAPAQKAIRTNLAALQIRSGYALEARSAAAAVTRLAGSGSRVDIVFLDPPYDRVDEYEMVLDLLGGEGSMLLSPGAIVIAEHAKRQSLAGQYGALHCYRTLVQGDAALSFYQAE
jgi:16S rRNA (guanine(966)-N(2))-methyltransferase RsmD